eukprot:TRINITY_DN8783_c0_g1_i1.p1 TRINITY_DN8783_c0_g1~~TRINITY_DN8783_c0_g1_i1.p1  ORF type:complete len:492 (+),score=87.45 TRINITY_DN8783_c0_g1_i1:1413-2888(+)
MLRICLVRHLFSSVENSDGRRLDFVILVVSLEPFRISRSSDQSQSSECTCTQSRSQFAVTMVAVPKGTLCLFFVVLTRGAADEALNQLKERSVDFIASDAKEWNDAKRFHDHIIYPSAGRICGDSAPKHWPRPQRLERLQLCHEIDRRSLQIRLDLAVQHADMNDFDAAEVYLRQITDEAYRRHREGKHPKPKAQAQYAGAIGGLVMLKRNHPTSPDPVAAAEEFFRANNTLEYVNWADTMVVCPEYDPSLRSMPWWDDRELLPGLAELERHIDTIRTELEQLINHNDPFKLETDFGLVAAGSWTEYILWQDGDFNEEHCMHFPWTCLHISNALLITGWKRYSTEYDLGGQVTILKMTPGTHLRVHTGGTNERLTVQLPLIIPDGIVFRVANDTRNYTPGSALVFDDCYEHEVQHLGATDRYVLYLTARHPDLNLNLHRPDWYDEKLLSIAREARSNELIDDNELERFKQTLKQMQRQDESLQAHMNREEL